MAAGNLEHDVVALVDDVIRTAIQQRASDVHFEPIDAGLGVLLRVDGLLSQRDVLPAALRANVVARLKVLAGLLTYQNDLPQEGAIPPERFACDIRVSTFPTIRGERAVLRMMGLSHRLLGLDELGHDPQQAARVKALLQRTQGLFVVCGPAGSGKTTTLYAILQHILCTQGGLSAITVEDPVEIRMPGVTQTQVHPARGMTYATALRSLLRQDPQVLVIGEVRDAEVAGILIDAALTGHRVLTSMHSGSPAEAILRLRDMGIPAYQLTSTLLGLWSQRLVRRLRGDGSDFEGRCAVGHLAEMTDAVAAAVLQGHDRRQLADVIGGSLLADGQRLVSQGLTTADEIERCVGRPEPS